MFRIIGSFIDMYLLAIYHCIRRFTGETCATIEGLREGRDLSVVVKETGRYGLQCLTTREGAGEGDDVRVVGKQVLRDGR